MAALWNSYRCIDIYHDQVNATANKRTILLSSAHVGGGILPHQCSKQERYGRRPVDPFDRVKTGDSANQFMMALDDDGDDDDANNHNKSQNSVKRKLLLDEESSSPNSKGTITQEIQER